MSWCSDRGSSFLLDHSFTNDITVLWFCLLVGIAFLNLTGINGDCIWLSTSGNHAGLLRMTWIRHL